MPTPQELLDEASFLYAQADYDGAIRGLTDLLASHPDHFDARLALGMALYRKGDYPGAIREGHAAEQLRPKEQLVHTNLSLFYMKSGDKQKAEHHGLQARIAGWRENMNAPAADPTGAADPELQMAQPKTPGFKTPPVPQREMPWKKKPPVEKSPASPSDPGAPTPANPTNDTPASQVPAGLASVGTRPDLPPDPPSSPRATTTDFIAVADLASLPPGKGRTVHARGREYSIWNLDGQVYCLDDECPHRGASLGAGQLDGFEAVCPLHGWAFDVRTGACSLRPDRPARTHPTRVVDGRIEIAVPTSQAS